MSANVATTRGIAWAAADRWGRQLVNFGVFIVLTRKLPPSEFGVVAIATLYLSFLDPFLGQGLGPALIRRSEVERSHLNVTFWLTLVVSLTLGAATVFSASYLASIFDEPRLPPVLAVLAITVPLSAFSIVPTAILTRGMEFGSLARRSLLAVLAGGVTGVACAFANLGVWSLVAQHLVTSTVSVLLLWAATHYRPAMEFSWSHLLDLRGIAVAVMANSIIWFACQRADQFIVGTWIGPAELAVYATAWRILTMTIDAVASPVAKVALPALAAVQLNPMEFDRTFNRLTIGVCALGIPAVVGLGVLGTDLVVALSGPRWSAAGPLLLMLAGNGIVRVFFVAGDAAMTVKGRPKVYVTLLTAQAIASVAASAIGAPWGVRGVAIAITISMGLQGLAAIWVIRTVLGVRVGPSVRAAVWFFGAATVMGGVIHLLAERLRPSQHPLLMVAEMVVLGATIYGLLALPVLLGPLRAMLKRGPSPGTAATPSAAHPRLSGR